MQPRNAIICAIVAISFGLAPCPAAVAQDTRASTAVLYNRKLIGLDEKGRLHACSLEDGKFDADTSSKLSRDSVTQLASDGDNPWVADKFTLNSWSPAERSWKKVSEFH